MSIFGGIRYHKKEVMAMKSEYAGNYRQLGLKISYYRKLRGLTQEQLAEKPGVYRPRRGTEHSEGHLPGYAV